MEYFKEIKTEFTNKTISKKYNDEFVRIIFQNHEFSDLLTFSIYKADISLWLDNLYKTFENEFFTTTNNTKVKIISYPNQDLIIIRKEMTGKNFDYILTKEELLKIESLLK